MSHKIDTDICVIGAGSGGLSVAAGAVQMGARVVLFERALMGGDCLNYGCVPSKALLAAAKAVAGIRHGEQFGVFCDSPRVDWEKVHAHVQAVIDTIAHHDSQERFEGLGVKVIREAGRFIDPNTVASDNHEVRAKYFVIATGSGPMIPPIDGLQSVPYITNESVFSLEKLPEMPAHLLVIGGGAIGVEMAQAHRRLGCEVTILEQFTMMPRDDTELVGLLRQKLQEEGITIHEQQKVERIEGQEGAIAVTRAGGSRVEGSHLLVAAGRKSDFSDLGLERAEIESNPGGIVTDQRLRTSNRRVFAIGDTVAGGPKFTHAAGYQSGIVIRNILFRLPSKVDYRAFPWVTYSDPELAQVGQTEAEAKKKDPQAYALRCPFVDNDRAQTELHTAGMVKLVVKKNGTVVGASILGRGAGELIQVWSLAISRRLKVGAIAPLIAPYPTLSEANKRAASSFFTPALFSERTRKIVRFLLSLSN